MFNKIYKVNSTSLPKPFAMEPKKEFVARFIKNLYVVHLHKTIAKRALAAERAWSKAKEESLVSITTSIDQFLIFS